MKHAAFAAMIIVGLALGKTDPVVSVHITAPKAGVAARISGPGVKVITAKPIRSATGVTVVSTPADVTLDLALGQFLVELEGDSSRVSVVVEDTNGHRISSSSRRLSIKLAEGKIQVIGVDPGKPGE